MTPLHDDDLKRLYARALVSIVRADEEIDAEEGERLKTRIEERSQLELEDVLLETAVHPDELAEAVAVGPFRSAPIRGDEIARMLVEDALYVTLGKGHITPDEGARLLRYARALGLPDDELQALTERWLP